MAIAVSPSHQFINPDSNNLNEKVKEEITISEINADNLSNEDSPPPTSAEDKGQKNRRKRKIPQKVVNEGPATPDYVNLSIPLPEFPDPRIESRMENSTPRSSCPVCGDKANGLHYGIYSCEGCKNFFKRSVVICQDRPYACKFSNDCNVGVYEADGIKRQRVRCQACRYQACIDAGMYHSGIPRSRGGRHGYSPLKNGKSSPANPPTSISNHVTISPLNTTDNNNEDDSNWEEMQMRQLTFNNLDLQHEVEMLKSKNRELSNALNERETQLKIAGKQIENLQNSVKNYSKIMERELDSKYVNIKKFPRINNSFNHGNGAVTITPVMAGGSSTSSDKKSNGIKLEDDMATIEAVHAVLSKNSATTIKHWKMESNDQ